MQPLSSHPVRFVIPSLLAGAAVACGSAGPESLAHAEGALVVSSSAACTVELSKLSYDDPSADDAEFLELRVVFAPGVSPGPVPDAAGGAGAGGASGEPCAPTEPEPPAAGPTTLGDCGLERLELVNGDASGCAPYRTFPLADVRIPEDGYVLVCSKSSLLYGSASCDVTAAGTSSLPNSWLQNGPHDGLRFVGSAGVVEVAYEPESSACFQTTPVIVPEESGTAEDGSDDVTVECGGSFVSVAGSAITLRAENPCPTKAAPAEEAGVTPNAPPDGSSSVPTPFAPPPSGSATQTVDHDVVPRVPDAGTGPGTSDGDTAKKSPSAPGCAFTADPGAPRAWALGPVAWILGAGFLRRRRAAQAT